ncbi:O-Antigen ligase [Abditibacterium utsteinense]|uniref:O-Antigen ligase n=1 Tax=Abditibacterium utsteinense TaxID=1960156 RepID=A0A2S8SSB8_9BACT|nr:O-antigen ligase family protein [Abditibacterium utsteinense]PQV63703.1 O-Antigen ligase [Abditibacterium utsteinense]
MQQFIPTSAVKSAHQAARPGGSAALYLWALLPLLLSFALFSVSPVLSIAIQLFVLCAVVGKLPFFVLAIFATMPFQQSLFGGDSASAPSVSLVDAFASLLFLILLFSLPNRGSLRIGPVAIPIFIYIGVSCASSLANWEGFSTAISLARMIMATLVAILIFANFSVAFRLAHRGFLIFLAALDVLAFFAMAAFARGGVEASMYTLGINKNALGPTFGCGIVTCISYLLTEPTQGRRALFLKTSLALCTIGCFLSLSRGAWVATTIAYLTILIISKNKRAFLGSILLMIPLIAILWHLLPKEAVQYASNVSSSAHTIQTRFQTINIVLSEFRSSPLLGVGIGLRKSVEPHNVLILTLGESGIIGLLGFLGMFAGGFYTFFLAWKKANDNVPNRQLILIGVSILLLSLVHGCMDVYWRRGIGFLGWASVGLAVQIIASARATSPLSPTLAAPRSLPERGRPRRVAKTTRVSDSPVSRPDFL